MGNKTINQHYIPQFYIKRFGYGISDNERISVLNLMSGEILHNQNPRNYASKRYLYDASREDLEKALDYDLKVFPELKGNELLNDEQFVEHALSRGEKEYKEILDLLEQDMHNIYDDSIRAVFIIFMHELAYRTVGYKDKMNSINNKMESQLNEFCDSMQLNYEDRKQVFNHNFISGKEIQLEKILSLNEILKTKDKLINNYDWYIGIYNTEMDFIISDNPLQTIWMGFNDICVPIFRRKAIIMRVKNDDKIASYGGSTDNTIDLSQKSVILYNSLQISMAHSFLFGSEKAIDYMKIINDKLKDAKKDN